MLEVSEQQNFTPIGNDLLKAISTCEERIRVSRQNETRYLEVSKQKNSAEQLLDMTRATANHMNKMYKNIKFFLENKKSSSKTILEASIHSVSTIVQDSELQSCTIKHENGKTKILNFKGVNINRVDGSGARATMGLLLRYTCLKALPNKIQLMLLDEALSTLSTTSSVNLREMLEIMSKDIGIVGIEQHDVLYRGLATKRYRALKVRNTSTINEEVVNYDGPS
jgi:hypothetical protein